MFTKILIFVVILVGIIFVMMDFYDRNGNGEEYDFVKFFKNLFK